jgi:galactose mutarotase-like enzyme
VIVRCGTTAATLLPHRGALVSRLTVDGRDLLYLDESTVDSPTGAVRGGIPLLFPIAGELPGNRLISTGTNMPRHGFARRKAWNVVAQSDGSLTLRLPMDDEIRAEYPLEFDATYEVSAMPNGVRLRLDVTNHSARQSPVAPGWHPYFPCPAALKRDCLAQLVPSQRLPATEPFECDVNIPTSADCRTEFSVPDLGRLVLTSSEQVKTLEIWTPAAKPFVCVEPWCGPSNVINTADAIRIDPGAAMSFWLTLEVLR